MHSLRPLLPLLLCFAASLSMAATESLVLNREAAVLQALQRNFNVKVQRIEVPIAAQSVRRERGAFDPAFEAEYRYQREAFAGAPYDGESTELSFGMRSRMPWGTELFVGVDSLDARQPGTASSPALDAVSAFSGITVTQPLLQGFGFAGTGFSVAIAQSNLQLSRAEFDATLSAVIAQTIAAFETALLTETNLEIAIRNRDLARQLLADNDVRVRSGAMAPLDRVQAEAEAALREVSVLNARNAHHQALNALRNLIFATPEDALAAPLILRASAPPPFAEPSFAADLAVALKARPELLSAMATAQATQLDARAQRRNALPKLDLVASFGRRGLADTFGDAVNRSLDSGEAVSAVGAVLRIPFPNRAANADSAIARLRSNQAALTEQAVKQQVYFDLDNAISQLRTDHQRIQATRTARELAAQALQAEERKLRVGNSSTFIVLRLQADLAFAEAREASAVYDYTLAHTAYLQAKGTLHSSFIAD